MRIVFFSNYYPPISIGGYELWCQEVAESLGMRNHQVHIITSKIDGKSDIDYVNNIPVHRILDVEVQGGLHRTIFRLLLTQKKIKQNNLTSIREILYKFKPDIVMIWGMWNVGHYVAEYVEKLLPEQVVYYLCDYWPMLPNAYIQRWQEPARHWFVKFPKKILGSMFLSSLNLEKQSYLKLCHPICVSQALCNKLVGSGVRIEHSDIIYGGVNFDEFFPKTFSSEPNYNSPMRLVYIGRLVPEKGIHTAVHAIIKIIQQDRLSVIFDIFGRGDNEYQQMLERLVEENGLENQIVFKGIVPRRSIPEVLSKYDGLIFPSEWDEPFARTVLEAMAAGLVVIGSSTGGTIEILDHKINGLVFPPGDVDALKNQLVFMYQNCPETQKMAQYATSIIRNNYQLSRMVDEIERKLFNVISQSSIYN